MKLPVEETEDSLATDDTLDRVTLFEDMRTLTTKMTKMILRKTLSKKG
jgi:hypothetical protein